MSGRNDPLLLLKSPLGDDTRPFEESTLHAIALSAVERLSEPFEIELTAVSTERAIDPDELLGQPVTITVRRREGLDRFFNGVVRRVDAVGFAQRGRWQYRLELVPRLRFLDQTIDCRIFQQKTAIEILQVIFAEHGVQPAEFRIFGERPRREYTTQYNETDLAFAQRLMQETGYFYFFEHTPSEHTLIVADSNEAFRMMERPSHRVIHNGENVDIFDTWSESLRTAYGRVRLQDYDPTRPSTPVFGERTATLQTNGAASRDVFRWPAMTTQNQIAQDRARFRAEADEAAASERSGHGYDPLLCPGGRFTLAVDPFTGAEGVDHVVTGTRHAATDETWIGGTSPPRFDCHFTGLRQTVSWRDALSIPRPAMTGIFSAIVLGEDGEEIHADRLARIKVRPLFDHRNETVAGMAIWARILNAWAGDRWGWQHLPRVGTEVGISFMNGDPDNPVVVGCFYHEENPPVFPIPSMQTRQGFRSRSTLHGGVQDYSELSFDDRRGQELVLLHAQRDHQVEVEHDQRATIGNDRTVRTTRNDSLTSLTGDIGIDSAVGAVTISAARTITLEVGANTIVISEAGITLNSIGVVSIEAAGAVSVSAGAEVTMEAAADANVTAGAAVTIEAIGDVNIAGAAVTIEAADGEVDCIPFPV